MAHPWVPNSAEEVKREMMKALGIESIEELYSDIPSSVKMSPEEWDSLPVGFGRTLSEQEIRRHMDDLFAKVEELRTPPFMGGGVLPRYVPEAVRAIVTRSEFLTAYTPYQAEMSQGLLQALFEYQSLMAELLEMEVVNSSMYDGSSALAEAFLMAIRVTGRKKFLVPETMNPRHRKVVETYLSAHGSVMEEVRVDRESGYLDLEDLGKKLEGAAAVYLEYPHYTGVVDVNAAAVGEMAHRAKALYVVGVEPVSMSILKPPGALGADIAVGEGQPLGLPLSYGGPYLGIFAIRWDRELVRQMPGRIVGLTTSRDGDEAFTLVLQTREQHIRRARATSNITTNEALMAIAAAAYMSLLGKEGLAELARHCWYKSHYAAKRLSEVIEAPLLKGDFVYEFVARLPKTAREVRRELLRKKGILVGIPLEGHAWFNERDLLIAVTEVHSKEDIDLLVSSVKEVL